MQVGQRQKIKCSLSVFILFYFFSHFLTQNQKQRIKQSVYSLSRHFFFSKTLSWTPVNKFQVKISARSLLHQVVKHTKASLPTPPKLITGYYPQNSVIYFPKFEQATRFGLGECQVWYNQNQAEKKTSPAIINSR